MKYAKTLQVSVTWKESLVIFGILLGLEAALSTGGAWWWSGDDPQILKHAISHHLWEFFFSPVAWRESSVSNLTPWVSLSYKMDWLLFGLNPWYFHLHQLLSVSIAVFLFYMVCRLFFLPLPSFFAALLLMLSRPVLEALDVLWVRHYVEGLAFALGAILCFMRGLERRRWPWQLASAMLYLLACSAKEIYVPLPVLLVALPVGEFKTRLKNLLPLFVVTGFYCGWRWWMLGAIARGYGKVISWTDFIWLPRKAMVAAGWTGAVSFICIATGSVFALAILEKRWKLFVISLTGLIFLPLVPVSQIMAPRYALLPALIVSLGIGWAVARLMTVRKKRWGDLIAVLLVLLAFGHLWVTNIHDWRPLLRQHLQQARVEGDYVFSKGNAGDFIENPAGAPWFYIGLAALRTDVLHLPPGPHTFQDPVFLLGRSGYRVLVFDSTLERLVVKREITGEMKQFLRRAKFNAPLWLRFRYKDLLATWEFGPWRKGNYAFIFDEYCQNVFPVPSSGKAPVQLLKDRRLRIRYTSPKGWVTYSPPLCLKICNGEASLDWRRTDHDG